jgi:hypothetical protein
VIDERRFRNQRAILHLSHVDHMVAFEVAAAVMAFEPGDAPIEDWLAGARQGKFVFIDDWDANPAYLASLSGRIMPAAAGK